MKINKIEYVKCDIAEKIREVKLLNSQIQPYKNARIDYVVDYPYKYLPCQNYVLNKQLLALNEIYFHAIEYGYNMGNLQGYLNIHTDHGVTTLTPPIIEVDNFMNGDLIINDGMHRMYYFMECTTDPVGMIVVDGASCPYYAYPTDWKKVKILDDFIPDDFVKKTHRIREYKALYRDFNTVFEHQVGKPRGKGKQ